jgi:hypothetical protein
LKCQAVMLHLTAQAIHSLWAACLRTRMPQNRGISWYGQRPMSVGARDRDRSICAYIYTLGYMQSVTHGIGTALALSDRDIVPSGDIRTSAISISIATAGLARGARGRGRQSVSCCPIRGCETARRTAFPTYTHLVLKAVLKLSQL